MAEPTAQSTVPPQTPDVLSTEYVENQLAAANTALDKVIEFGVQYGLQIFGALIILVVGYLISCWIQSIIVRMLEKRNIDQTTSLFIGKATKMMLMFVAMIVAMGNFGVSISPMIAALGALTFGITLALQGPISNYGAGLAIIMGHPFRIGDTIKLQDVSGIVEDIRLANTMLSTADGERITIPNSQVVGQILTNSGATTLAVSRIGISYNDDPQNAISAIGSVLNNIEEISKDTEQQIGIYEFGDSSINIQARYWVPTRRYYPLLHRTNMEIYNKLIDAGISIPFPQRVIKIVSEEPATAKG